MELLLNQLLDSGRISSFDLLAPFFASLQIWSTIWSGVILFMSHEGGLRE